MVPDRQASAAGGDAQTPSDPATPRTRDPADRTTTVGAKPVHGRLDQVPTALVTTDRDGDIRYSNLAARELLDPHRAGLARENLLDLAVDEDRAAVARAHHLALGGQRRPPYVVRIST